MNLLNYLDQHKEDIYAFIVSFYAYVVHAGGLREIWRNFLGDKNAPDAQPKPASTDAQPKATP